MAAIISPAGLVMPGHAGPGQLREPSPVATDHPRTCFHVVLGGTAMVGGARQPGRAVLLAPGDLVVATGGRDQPRANGSQLCAACTVQLGTQPWSPGAGRPTLLSGWLADHASCAGPLLAGLPALVVLRDERRDTEVRKTVDHLTTEVAVRRRGSGGAITHLVDSLMILTVRAWLAGNAQAPGRPRRPDPVVAAALAALHSDPAHSWTVADLASRARVSRATLARRFAAHTGEGPLTYLTRWRMTLAALRLRDTDASVRSVARTVGYRSPYALSKAFTRAHGQAPSAFRRLHHDARADETPRHHVALLSHSSDGLRSRSVDL